MASCLSAERLLAVERKDIEFHAQAESQFSGGEFFRDSRLIRASAAKKIPP